MSGCHKCFLCFVLVFLAIDSVQGATPFPHKILDEVHRMGEELQKDPPLRLNLLESERGLELSLSFTAVKEIPLNDLTSEMLGGDYLIFLDENVIINEVYSGSSLEISREIPLTLLQTGRHILRCELRSPYGAIVKDEIDFLFDGSPVIDVTNVVVDETGMLDPLLKMDFLPVENGVIGTFDVFLDEFPYLTAQITTDHIGKQVPLSLIVEQPLSTANLSPGTHLLTLVVRGIAGNEATSYSSFTVNASPSLKVFSGDNDDFQEAVATFLETSDGYSGGVEIFLNHNLILSKRNTGTSISINRAEIIDNMKKANQEYNAAGVPLIFSLHAANGSQYWQKIDFK